MKIHLIAIGGAIMHNLALELADNGHIISGSDDNIYNPAFKKLQDANLLPKELGWHPETITNELDLIIVGMHARNDNPELKKAQELHLKIVSFPQFMFEHAKHKLRIVVAGSHGKTTTTSLILHILETAKKNCDYLVGAQIKGYKNMVKISDAPIAVFEGDEYSSSPMDLSPKFLHYQPHITIITGIAWDHFNIFPTHESYMKPFNDLILDSKKRGKVIAFSGDHDLKKLTEQLETAQYIPYRGFKYEVKEGKTLLHFNDVKLEIQIFGAHNIQNLHAAYLACREVGVSDNEFITACKTLESPARRLEVIRKFEQHITYFDFAHAPSKVKATISAVREKHQNAKIVGIFELHTFSSINKSFLPEYKNSLQGLDEAFIFYNPETSKLKNMETLSDIDIQHFFNQSNIRIITEKSKMLDFLTNFPIQNSILLIMTSGDFGGIDVRNLY